MNRHICVYMYTRMCTWMCVCENVCVYVKHPSKREHITNFCFI